MLALCKAVSVEYYEEHTKFAVLVVVHTQQLGLLASPQLKARNEIDALGDDRRHDEGVGGASDNVSDLDVKLLPVVVDPTADNAVVHTVQTDNVVGTKERVEDQTDHSTDSVFSEHIERIVNANQELDLGGKVTANAGDNAEDNRRPWGDETGSGSGGHESRDGT